MHQILFWPDTRQAGYPANLSALYWISDEAGYWIPYLVRYPAGFLTQHLNVSKNTKKQQQGNQRQFFQTLNIAISFHA
jgi:hypothetical protein